MTIADRVTDALAVIRKASGTADIDKAAFQVEVEALFDAVGFDSDEIVGSITGSSIRNAKKLAADFRIMARAVNPIRSARCRNHAEAHLGQGLRTRQREWLRSKQVSLERPIAALRCRRLHGPDREVIRSVCEALAISFERQRTRGRTPDLRTQTLLVELADIYCRYTGFREDRFLLPHGDRSHFVQFVEALIGTGYYHGIRGRQPLAEMWRRLKKQNTG